MHTQTHRHIDMHAQTQTHSRTRVHTYLHTAHKTQGSPLGPSPGVRGYNLARRASQGCHAQERTPAVRRGLVPTREAMVGVAPQRVRGSHGPGGHSKCRYRAGLPSLPSKTRHGATPFVLCQRLYLALSNLGIFKLNQGWFSLSWMFCGCFEALC